MAGMNSIPQLTAEQKNFLLSKSPFVLPDNPSDKHFSPAQIKRKMYEGLVVLYDYINQLISAINADITLSNADVAQINSDLTTIYGYFVEGIAKKATADASGNVITSTYETKTDASTKFNTNKDEIDKIKDGTTVVKRAQQDESGNNIKSNYVAGSSYQLFGSETAFILKIFLKNKLNETISTVSQTFGSATTATAGLLSAEDKIKINSIAGDIATALAQAKSYADALVLRSNLASILGEASSSLNGLMSATDKAHLDALYALLGDTEDADSVVDTINEVLAIFNEYPEGADLVGALALKIDYADIIDNLTSDDATKPLSAKQGKALKALIDALSSAKADASSVYLKTETYSQTQADDKFRTQNQVDAQIASALQNVDGLNVIADKDNNKNYDWKIEVENGKASLILTEIE